MGLFDSIGNLGNLGGIGSITKMFDVGNIVKGVVDKVLPQNMHFVGDVAGAVVDFKTGNFIGAAQLGMEALKDLPQAAKGAQQQPGKAASGGTAGGHLAPPNPTLEPSPPPLARDPKSFDWNDLLSAVKALTAALTGQGAKATADTTAKPTGSSGTTAPTTASTAAPASTTASTAAPASTTASTAAPASTHQESAKEFYDEYTKQAGGWRAGPHSASPGSSSQTTWQGQPQTPAPAAPTRTPAATSVSPASTPAVTGASSTSTSSAAAAPAPATTAPAPVANHPAASATATSATAAKPAAGASTPAAVSSDKDKGQTISSLSQLQGMSDAAIRDAVLNGRISPDFAKDQAGMMALQQRMNAITEMNNLMTAMMRAIHDMQMAVIQNIRI